MNRNKYVKYYLGGNVPGASGSYSGYGVYDDSYQGYGSSGIPNYRGYGGYGEYSGDPSYSSIPGYSTAARDQSMFSVALGGAAQGAAPAVSNAISSAASNTPSGAPSGGVQGGASPTDSLAAFHPAMAIVGAATGAGQAILELKLARMREREQEARFMKQMNALRSNRSRSVLSTYPTEGTETYSYYKYGGKLPWSKPDYLAEGGEVVEYDMSNRPVAYNGNLNRLSSDLAEIKGPSHNQPSGGVGMSGGERIFSDSMSIPPSLSKYFLR